MYYYDELIAEVSVTEETDSVVTPLPHLVPIGRIYKTGDSCQISVSADGQTFEHIEEHGGNITAGYIKVVCQGSCRVKFFVGKGYWAQEEYRYTDAMKQTMEWAGSDGINSFNLENGKDSYGADCHNTLFVFGDTLVSRVDKKTNERIPPVYMPSNTYGIMNKIPEDIQFVIKKDEEGIPQPVLSPVKSKEEDGWFWLQDGVVVGGNLYLTPLNMKSDLSKPEGFQFKVDGVTMVKVPVRDKKPVFDEAEFYPASLYKRMEGRQYIGGIAYLPYAPEFGYDEGDGFLYVYGYQNDVDQIQDCRVFVGRTKPENIRDTESWEYFNGKKFVTGIENAAVILEHASCEMSVMPIIEGDMKGKFLAVFQYDVQSSYVAYSIGETPWGPFESQCKVYHCKEKIYLCNSVYTYNAKAHSHLSKPESILVSYNVNTPSMKDNCRIADIYRPRFILLHDTTIKKGRWQ